jgi:hypothetical protein
MARLRLRHPFLLKILDRFTITLPRYLPVLNRRNDLSGAIRRLAALPAGEMPSTDLLDDLRFSWGNAGFSPSLDLIEHTARCAISTKGPVLECGSGLTTVVLGALLAKRGVPVWSLEHHRKWRIHMRRMVAKHRLGNVTICRTPLRDYGAFSWYDRPRESLPTDFRLVICDGPPRLTQGGRYGLMPVLGESLADDCVIILDDTYRRSERKVIEAWAEHKPLRTREIGESRSLTEISFVQ